MRFCFFFILFILTSSEIPLKVERFELLIEGAADLDSRKVFRRLPPVPTFVLHVDKINLTCQQFYDFPCPRRKTTKGANTK